MKKRTLLLCTVPTVFSILFIIFYPLFSIILPTLSHNYEFRGYIDFINNGYDINIILRTLLISFITTLITLMLGFPISLWIARRKTSIKKLLMLLVLFPMLTNAVVRNFSWIIILGKNGLINKLLMDFHVIDHPLNLLYTNFSIIIGLIYLFLPIMIISLVGIIGELNFEIEDAAYILGANRFKTLFKVIIPQLSTGILTGCVLVFAGSMTAYTTPEILGGNQHLVLSTLIYQQATTLGNWNNATIISAILIFLSIVSTTLMKLIMNQIDRRKTA